MAIKKQSKRITPSKLIKTNGKFSWKKMLIIIVLLGIVGTLIIRNTFAGNIFVFYNGAPTYQLRSSGNITAKDSQGIHFREHSTINTYAANSSNGTIEYNSSNPSGITVKTCFIGVELDSKNTDEKFVDIRIHDALWNGGTSYSYSLKGIALLMSQNNSLKLNYWNTATNMQVVAGDFCINTGMPTGWHAVQAQFEINAWQSPVAGRLKQIWLQTY